MFKFFDLILNGSNIQLELLIKRDPSICLKTDEYGMTGLMYACWQGRYKAVDMLLPHSNIDATCYDPKWTAMDYALNHVQFKCVMLLNNYEQKKRLEIWKNLK